MSKMTDVAKAAGVSKSTVSNVLNNPYMVSEEKYNQVISAMQKLNYTPNQNAAKLRSSKKSAIAIIIPEFTHFYSKIVQQIITQMTVNEYSCAVQLTYYNQKIEEELLVKCQTSGISGVFLWSSGPNSQYLLESLLDKAIPVVLIGSNSPSTRITSVTYNVYDEAYFTASRAVSGLLSGGKLLNEGNTVIITGPESLESQRQCYAGFCKCLEENGICPRNISIRISSEFACIDFLNAILSDDCSHLPDVVFCTANSAVAGIRQAAEYLGINPEIVYLGADKWIDINESNTYGSRIDSGKIGQCSAKLMTEYLKSPRFFEPQHVVLENIDTKVWDHQPATAAKTKSITLTLYNRPWADIVQKLLPLFKKETGIEVNYECMPDSMSLMNRARQSGSWDNDDMDVFVLPHYCLKYFTSDEYLLKLNDYLRNDGFNIKDEYPIEIQRVSCLDSEDIYAVPLTFNTQLLFFRKDLFERDDIRRRFYREYGIELIPPKTWTDFDIISHFFTREFNPDSPVPYGTTFNMSPRASLVEEFYPRQWAYNGRVISKTTGRPVLNSTQNLMALQNMYKAYECIPKGSTSETTDNHTMRILSNDIAMHNTFATYIPNNMGVGTIDYQRIGCTVIPGGRPLLSGWMLCINSKSRNKDASYAFIKWITQKRFAEMNAFLGLFNPKNILMDNIHCQDVFPWTGSFLNDIAKTGSQEGMITRSGEIVYPRYIVGLIHQGLYNALTNSVPAEKALDDMNNTLERIYLGEKI